MNRNADRKIFRNSLRRKNFGIIGAVVGLLTIPIGWIAERTSQASPTENISWASYLSPLHLLIIIASGAAMGFIYGLIGAGVYNLVARWTGGIQVEI